MNYLLKWSWKHKALVLYFGFVCMKKSIWKVISLNTHKQNFAESTQLSILAIIQKSGNDLIVVCFKIYS